MKRGVVTGKALNGYKFPNLWRGARYLTTQDAKADNLFPERVDFPSRHIGPRGQDVVTMLDLLGYKVCYFFFAFLYMKIRGKSSA